MTETELRKIPVGAVLELKCSDGERWRFWITFNGISGDEEWLRWTERSHISNKGNPYTHFPCARLLHLAEIDFDGLDRSDPQVRFFERCNQRQSIRRIA
jgi:hypothetical protein